MAVTQFFDPFGVQLEDRNTESQIGYRNALTATNLMSIQQQMDQRANRIAYMADMQAREQQQQQARQQAITGPGPAGGAGQGPQTINPNGIPSASDRIVNELQDIDQRISSAAKYNLIDEVDRLTKAREQVQGRYSAALGREELGRKRLEEERDRRIKVVSGFASGANAVLNDGTMAPEERVQALKDLESTIKQENPEAYKALTAGAPQLDWTDRRTWNRMKALEQQAIAPEKRMELGISQQRADEQAKRDATYQQNVDRLIAQSRESDRRRDEPKPPVGMRWTDKTHSEIEPIPVRGASTAETKGLTGEEFLAALPPGDAGLIKGIADGKVDPKTLSIRGGHREQILKEVLQYRPDFNQAKFPVYQAVQKDFTSGVAARNVTAINTAIAHMGTLDELGQALQNKDTQVINKVTNAVASQFGDPRINNFQTAASALSSEMMRVFRQVGASEKEQKDWESKFGDIQSPEQMKGALKTGAKLLEGRIDALNDQWKRGMDSKQGYPDLLAPKSVQVVNKLGLKVPGAEAAPAKKSSGPVPLDEYLKSQGAH